MFGWLFRLCKFIFINPGHWNVLFSLIFQLDLILILIISTDDNSWMTVEMSRNDIKSIFSPVQILSKMLFISTFQTFCDRFCQTWHLKVILFFYLSPKIQLNCRDDGCWCENNSSFCQWLWMFPFLSIFYHTSQTFFF